MNNMDVLVNKGKQLGESFLNKQEDSAAQRKAEFEKYLGSLAKVDPTLGGFEEIGALLAMSEESFSVVAPVFLDELEKGLARTTDRLILAQSLNLSGLTMDELWKQYQVICQQMDEQMADLLTAQKRDFLKRMLGMTYNTVAEAIGENDKTKLIYVEKCHPDAKIPQYGHLRDAGADVYAVEDVTIEPGETKLVPTGLKVAIPQGYALLVHPRSGLSLKTKMRIANSIGLIDSKEEASQWAA